MDKDLLVTILFDNLNKGRQRYKLEQELIFKGWEHEVGIYKGFISDLVSLPWILRLLASPTGRWAHASLFHDFLYRTHLTTRREADQIFFKIMRDFDVPDWKSKGAYYLVRLFGSIAYKKYKKDVDMYRKYGYVENIKR